MVRSGIGYDVHQLKSGLELYIGGIKVESDYGSLGHSDGDALIHSVVDSLLGAANLGDIGKHFPSDQEKWAGAKSEIFLFKAKNMLFENGFQISNIDCTITLQSPQVGPYISKIRKNISKMLELNEKKVSIKATTTDYLGYIGQSKGWSAISIATIFEINENS